MHLPPATPEGTMRVVPLGGLGEIGRNMTTVEYAEQLLIVDCGVLFPDDQQPGVDLILPDFASIADRIDLVQGVVLTHGHEDHIGAVPYLLRLREDIPLIGSRLTIAMVTAKLREFRITPVTFVVDDEQQLQVGPFDLEFLAVTHSIPDAMAVTVTTEAGRLLFTGDFKMDQLPLDGRLTDLHGFAKMGRRGVDLLLVDSTNAEVPGYTPLERDIAPVLGRVLAQAQQRVIIACFASHVHRVQQIIDASAAAGRRVALVGRSMVRNMGVARELGYLNVPPGLLVEPNELDRIPPHEVVIVSTGSQGEPMAVLSRIAHGRHSDISVGPGDVIVLASSLIPGNETSVGRVINGLTRLGATVVHKGNANVHVSGHAAAGELLLTYNLLRPRNVMPVHGEPRHLRANARLAELAGVAPERIIVADDGVVVDVRDGLAEVVGHIPCGHVFVDGANVGDVADASLKDRRILGQEGFIAVVVTVDAETGALVNRPTIMARGVAEDESVFAPVLVLIEEAVARAGIAVTDDTYPLEQLVRRVTGRWVAQVLRRKPMILPTVVVV